MFEGKYPIMAEEMRKWPDRLPPDRFCRNFWLSTVEPAVEAIRPGAYHFLPKAFSEDKPRGLVLSALKETLGRSAVIRDGEHFTFRTSAPKWWSLAHARGGDPAQQPDGSLWNCLGPFYQSLKGGKG